MIGAKIYPFLLAYRLAGQPHIIFPRTGCDLWDGFDMICAKQWSDGSPIGLYIIVVTRIDVNRESLEVLQPVSESKH